MSNEIKIDTKVLDGLIIEIGKEYYIKVGVLSGKDPRDDNNSNATIGLKHEFGVISEGLIARSFLKVPLNEEMPKRKNKIGKIVGEAITTQDFKRGAVRIGSMALDVVNGAFRTGGYGKWDPLSSRRIEQKKEEGLSENILMATTQLRRSITFEVFKK